jgi:predicted esterase
MESPESFFTLLIRGLPFFLVGASMLAHADSAVTWIEGEHYLRTPEATDQTASRLTASGGFALPASLLDNSGMCVSYDFDIPADCADAKIVFRYARFHWNEMMTPAKINLEMIGESQRLTGRIVFGNTGGWGTECRDWGLAEVALGSLKKGSVRLTLTSDSDRSGVVIDGFWLADNGFKMTREELSPLNRIQITGRGYLGIDLNYSGIEQSAFPGFSVTGRAFQPQEERVSVELRNNQGQVATAFCKDRLLLLGNKPTPLPVPGSWIRDLPDGNYTLGVSWDGGAAVLSQPFTAIGGLLAECEKERSGIAQVLESCADKKSSVAADLQYACDYLENGVVLLRSRGKAAVEESAYKKGVAYFEKAGFRTAEMFAADLKAFIAQTKETTARLKNGQDPYRGRTGDLRRAFYSEATGRLEPYRIFVPSSYGKAGNLPVLMTLHGGGGDENYFPDLENGAVLSIMEKRRYLMISPKATSWYANRVGQADLKQLFDIVQREYPKTDKARFYCTGVSRGGYGSYQTAGTWPDLLAGIACVSGAGNNASDGEPLVLDMSVFKRIPVLILHGGIDNVILPKVAENAQTVLKELGCTVELKIFPAYGHEYHAEEYMTRTLDFFEKNAPRL